MACVVGLIMAIRSAVPSVNQRFPSGPDVIPLGPAPAVGMGNSLRVTASSQRGSKPSTSGLQRALPDRACVPSLDPPPRPGIARIRAALP